MIEAVRQVSGEDCEITGASRTDSGAHALGQVCHFDLEAAIPAERWPAALNRALPRDIRVRSAAEVDSAFHSRFCARDRSYRYRILQNESDPFRGRFAHREPRPLDVDRMRASATLLIGLHDFIAFTAELSPDVGNTMRTLRSVGVSRVRDEVRIDVVGTAFLRGMMRRIAGALLEVGRDRRKPESLRALLVGGLNPDTQPVVLPAHGLTLMRVRYGRHPVDNRANNETASDEA